jgi:hypothetical protein
LERRKATVSRVIFSSKETKFSSARLKRGGDPLLKHATNEEHKITLTETPVLLSVCFSLFPRKALLLKQLLLFLPAFERERENESIPEERTDTFFLRFASRCPALRVDDDDDDDENDDDGNNEREDHLFKEQNRTEDVLFKD